MKKFYVFVMVCVMVFAASSAWALSIVVHNQKTDESGLSNSILAGKVGEEYNVAFRYEGYKIPYNMRWYVTGSLPGGLNFDSGNDTYPGGPAFLTGTPNTAGEYPITVMLNDETHHESDQRSFTIVISGGSSGNSSGGGGCDVGLGGVIFLAGAMMFKFRR